MKFNIACRLECACSVVHVNHEIWSRLIKILTQCQRLTIHVNLLDDLIFNTGL